MMRVLITREEAEPLSILLTEVGVVPVHEPLIELSATGIEPPGHYVDVVLITSAAVVRFVPNLSKAIGKARVVAVGARTKDALEHCGVTVSAVGSMGGLGALDLASIKPGETAWYVGAEEPSMALGMALEQEGWIRWPVYRNRFVATTKSESIQAEPVDIITFTSGSAVHAYVDRFGLPMAAVAVIGPSTASVASTLGVHVDVVASTPTMESLVEAIQTLL
jgi:uroporphyrinogen-III synthase